MMRFVLATDVYLYIMINSGNAFLFKQVVLSEILLSITQLLSCEVFRELDEE